MYIDYDNYAEFEDYLVSLEGQFLSPGGVGKIYNASRQSIHQWIVKDIINGHRCKSSVSGGRGYFIIVPTDELVKVDAYKIKLGSI